jgi:malonyl-CoA O-methyltransferase
MGLLPIEMPLREAYDEWALDYPAEAHNPLMHAEEDAVIARLQGLSIARVLDAGAGTGRYTRILRSLGARTIVSLDWSWGMLHRQAGDAARICGDARRLPFADRTFDLVNASLMAGDIEDLGQWLREVSRVLTPAGRLVYSDFHPEWHERGWRRTFQDRRGRTVEIPCCLHSRDTHCRSLADAGFSLQNMDEVSVTPEVGRFSRWRPGAQRPVRALVVVSAIRDPAGRR